MDVLLTRTDLKELGIKISNSTMLRMEAQGKMPKRRYLTPRTVAWSRNEIEEFLATLLQTEDRHPRESTVDLNPEAFIDHDLPLS